MIYLMRHADAVSDDVDPVRPLSPRGREQVARVCGVLRKGGGFVPAEVWHSSLARSRETASLLVGGLGLKATLVMTSGLEPEDDPARVAAILNNEKRDIAVVGHEPHLGVLASLLVFGPERPALFYPFPKAGVMALSREGKRWRSEWIIRTP